MSAAIDAELDRIMLVASIALERYLLFGEPFEYAAAAAECFIASGAIHDPAPASSSKRVLLLAGVLRHFG